MSLGRCECINESEKDMLLWLTEEHLFELEKQIAEWERTVNKYPSIADDHGWLQMLESTRSAHKRFHNLAAELRETDPCYQEVKTVFSAQQGDRGEV